MKHRLTCCVCGKQFEAERSHRKYCSVRCSSKGQLNDSGPKLPTSTIGAVSELRVCAYFLERGYYVFRSVTPNAPCDLMVLKGEIMLRVEVKTGAEFKSGGFRYTTILGNLLWVDCIAVVGYDGSVRFHTPDRKTFELPTSESMQP